MTTDDDLIRRLQEAQASAQSAGNALADVVAVEHRPGRQDAFSPCFDSLEDWVVSVFCKTYVRRSTPAFRWCGEWWRHPEAISRLEALWRSWEALRLDPLLGMSSWYASHLDHQLPVLTSAAGPFADCDPTQHFPPADERLHHVTAPTDWWPPARGLTRHRDR